MKLLATRYIRARARAMKALRSCHFERLHAASTFYNKTKLFHTMTTEYRFSDPEPSSSTTCYFSFPVALAHYSVDTPLTTPFATFSTETDSHPDHPLLALRRLSLEDHMSASQNASKLLQLQTAAAHRPATQPLQHTSSNSSNDSNSSMGSPSTLCCCRCRRESASSMIQFATNLYYCHHCAKMTGYCVG
jgi:hypothetical protein